MRVTQQRLGIFSIGLLFGVGLYGLVRFGARGDEAKPGIVLVFEQDLTRLVGIRRAGLDYVGRLDANGRFTPLPDIIAIDPSHPPVNKPNYELINYPRTNPTYEWRGGIYVRVIPPEPVFEYRAGRVIAGHLDETGNFTPSLSSKVRSFNTSWSPGTPRVYNVPGRYVEYKQPKR